MQVSEELSEGEVRLCVHSCPFHAYFWDAGRVDLMPILCAWDVGWMDEVNAGERPLDVTLQGTLAEGAAACAFVFRRRLVKDGHATASAGSIGANGQGGRIGQMTRAR